MLLSAKTICMKNMKYVKHDMILCSSYVISKINLTEKNTYYEAHLINDIVTLSYHPQKRKFGEIASLVRSHYCC